MSGPCAGTTLCPRTSRILPRLCRPDPSHTRRPGPETVALADPVCAWGPGRPASLLQKGWGTGRQPGRAAARPAGPEEPHRVVEDLQMTTATISDVELQ